MKRLKILFLLLLLGAAALFQMQALAEENDWAVVDEAQEISAECTFNGYSGMDKLWNDLYKDHYDPLTTEEGCSIVIAAPDQEKIGAVQLRFYGKPVALRMQIPDGEGGWTTVAETKGSFYVEGFHLEGISVCRIISYDPANDLRHPQLHITELRVYTPGELPASFQDWEEAGEKVDLMLIVAHPDDEVLWFGGLLPTYAGEQHKNVLVVCYTAPSNVRKMELLNSLWTCGVRTHPYFGEKLDVNSSNINDIYKQWGELGATREICDLYRRYKPDVVCLHDLMGEYGHGAHKACAKAGCDAVEAAADAGQFIQSVKEYGTWQVKKVYVHLYTERVIHMDWWQPLSRFDGKTAQDVAREGMACHKTQLGKKHRGWAVEDGGEYDNSCFGLYYTAVGEDTAGNDMFENIP